MRTSLLDEMKLKIELTLSSYLREEGIEFFVAANDNLPPHAIPLVELRAIESGPLKDSHLLSEIKVILGILGKPWQCDRLVNGIYEVLQPHELTPRDLTVLLISLHVERIHCVKPRHMKKDAVIRYILEETPAPAGGSGTKQITGTRNAEYC